MKKKSFDYSVLCVFIFFSLFSLPACAHVIFNPLWWIKALMLPAFLVTSTLSGVYSGFSDPGILSSDAPMRSNGDTVAGPFITHLPGGRVDILQHCGAGRWLQKEISSQHITPDLCEGSDLTITPSQTTTPNTVWAMPEKLLAVSDLEGNLPKFQQFLLDHGVINHEHSWQWGNNQIVIVGDSVDRGEYTFELVWFIRGLQVQAKKAGGNVHFLLGNHEFMNLEGDFRYVSPYQNALMEVTEERFDFNPFDDNQELTLWLKKQNTVIKIGDLLFVHGGFSKQLIDKGYSLEKINKLVRSCMGDLFEGDCMVTGGNGPFWYRGHFTNYNTQTVNQLLEKFSAKKIVVGHTMVPQPGYINKHKKVIGLDVDWHRGHGAGVIFEKNGNWKAVYGKKNRSHKHFKSRSSEL